MGILKSQKRDGFTSFDEDAGHGWWLDASTWSRHGLKRYNRVDLYLFSIFA